MKDKSGSKKLYGLLGKNISYSLSPVMHNAAFEKFRINAEYTIFDKQEEDLEAFMREEILTGKVSGINVTVPYKIIMKDMVEKYMSEKYPDIHLNQVVNFIGTLNTIKLDEDKLRTRNTDPQGFLDALKKEADFSVDGKEILILGAGGAGRAISLYVGLIKNSTINRLHVYDIDSDKLSELEEYCRGDGEGKVDLNKIGFIKSQDELFSVLSGVDLVVNATPVGTKDGDPAPIDVTLCKDSAVIYDLVYARETELLKQAKAKDLKAVNGLGMLVGQGARSFYYWTEDHWNKEGVTENEALDKISKEMFKGIEKS